MSRPRRPTPTVSLFRRYVSNAVQGLSKAREGSRNLAHVLFFLHSKEFVEKLTSSRASWFQSHVTEFNLTCMLKSEQATGRVQSAAFEVCLVIRYPLLFSVSFSPTR